MRKVFVSTLVLSMSMGIMYDVSAQRNRASVITSRTARAGNRRGSSSSSSSQSSSSTTNVDITTTTQRFKNNKYDFDSKLYYDNEYELRDFLTSATYNYYYNNGSNSINEKLCFGPYMFVNKNTNNTNYMDYIGVEKSEAKRTCIDIMPNMTYTIGLIPASDSAVETASAEGRYLTIQNNNFPSRDIKKLLSTEKYVDVSEYAKSITDTFNNVKSYCGNYNENMDSIRKQLGAVFGTSLGGTALSAGATAVNILNVKKTEETGSFINQKIKNQESIKELNKKSGIKNDSVEDKKQVSEEDDKCSNIGKYDVSPFIERYNLKADIIYNKAIDVGNNFTMVDGPCYDSEKTELTQIGLSYLCDINYRKSEIKSWQNTSDFEGVDTFCRDSWKVGSPDEGNKYECMKHFMKYYFAIAYGFDFYNGLYSYKLSSNIFANQIVDSKDKVLAHTNSMILDMDVGDDYNKDTLLGLLDNALITKDNCGKTENSVDNNSEITSENKELVGNNSEITSNKKEIEATLNRYQNNNNKLNTKIDANNESSEKMDKANVWLSGASTLASSISVVFSSTAVAKVKEALENLEKCQKSLTELKTTFAEYNAEIEAEEGE